MGYWYSSDILPLPLLTKTEITCHVSLLDFIRIWAQGKYQVEYVSFDHFPLTELTDFATAIILAFQNEDKTFRP